jgi:hypothetical protein
MFDWSKRLTALQGWPLICYDPLSYIIVAVLWHFRYWSLSLTYVQAFWRPKDKRWAQLRFRNLDKQLARFFLKSAKFLKLRWGVRRIRCSDWPTFFVRGSWRECFGTRKRLKLECAGRFYCWELRNTWFILPNMIFTSHYHVTWDVITSGWSEDLADYVCWFKRSWLNYWIMRGFP